MTPEKLPIDAIRADLASALKVGNIVVIAPTGSGKTTRVPQMILDNPEIARGKVLVVEPRKLACTSVAQRIADERGVKIGGEVGHIVRYDAQVSESTNLCFITDGVLMRFLERDPHLNGVSTVIFDEFHERRMLSDLSLGILRKAQKHRSDLRLIAMSATTEVKSVAEYLNAHVLKADGIIYPVEIKHHDRWLSEMKMPAVIVDLICRQHRTGFRGDTLVFLPGKREIGTVEQILKRRRLPDVSIMALHGDMSRLNQDKIFGAFPGRKIILATNIAEASITIPGVCMVIDTGLERRSAFDADLGVTRLNTHQISHASAKQRAGRAGRERPGSCIRLWPLQTHEEAEHFTPPEIHRCDLASVVLTLKSVGIKEAEKFPFLDAPPNEAIQSAEKLLKVLGALDEGGELTKLGRNMLALPLSPRYAKMVVEAERSRCVKEVASVAAMLSGKPIFRKTPAEMLKIKQEQRAFAVDDSSDFFTYLEIFNQWRKHRFSAEWCERHCLDVDALQEAKRLRRKIIRVAFMRQTTWNHWPASRATVKRCLASGFVDRVAKQLNPREYQLVTGQTLTLDTASSANGKLLVIADLRIVREKFASSTLATVVTAEEMQQLAPTFVETRSEVLEFLPATGAAKVRESIWCGELRLAKRENLVDWKTAWQISMQLERNAKARGCVAAEVKAAARDEYVALVDGQRIPVDADSEGRYWVYLITIEEERRLKLYARETFIPKPPERTYRSLDVHLARTTILVNRINGK